MGPPASASHMRGAAATNNNSTEAPFFFFPASRFPRKKRPPDSNSAGPAYPKTAAVFFRGNAGVWVPKIY